jgi:curved DNA-binding protein
VAGKKTHYQVLGVLPDASAEQIRAAFRRQAKLYHPDRMATGDVSRFQRLQQAYEILCDPRQRREYDVSLRPSPRRSVRPSQNEHTSPGSGHDAGSSLDAMLRAMFGHGLSGAAESSRFETRRRSSFVDPSYSDEGTDAGRYAESERQASDVDYDIYLSAREAARGMRATLRTDTGPSIDVQIPAGVFNGEVLTAEYVVHGRVHSLNLLVHIRR